eukprot:m.1200614 g.1200614  ORF g.1200614 m.1200614 type:complete len:333 (+) comp24574_c0_seq19:1819-2817(+)
MLKRTPPSPLSTVVASSVETVSIGSAESPSAGTPTRVLSPLSTEARAFSLPTESTHPQNVPATSAASATMPGDRPIARVASTAVGDAALTQSCGKQHTPPSKPASAAQRPDTAPRPVARARSLSSAVAISHVASQSAAPSPRAPRVRRATLAGILPVLWGLPFTAMLTSQYLTPCCVPGIVILVVSRRNACLGNMDCFSLQHGSVSGAPCRERASAVATDSHHLPVCGTNSIPSSAASQQHRRRCEQWSKHWRTHTCRRCQDRTSTCQQCSRCRPAACKNNGCHTAPLPPVKATTGSLAVRHKHRCCARKHTSVVDAPASNDLEDLRLKRNR